MKHDLPIASRVRTEAIVNRYLVKAHKNLGQNFLVDLEAVRGIVAAAEIKPGDQVIEIGPGIGSLTEQLLLAGAQVLAYEVDPDLKQILANELPNQDQFKLIMQDVLKADLVKDADSYFANKKPVKIVANLPYYITTPIIFRLLNSNLHFASLTLMMQKEVADRIAANSGSKAYGPLTIAVQTQMKVAQALAVDHTSFWPQPKVDSSVLVLAPLAKPLVAPSDAKRFNRYVKMCFAQRRKTLNNNLKSFVKEQDERQKLIASLGVKPTARPEELTIPQLIKLIAALP
ncbi:MAG: 16S rRNA (adenine(1518)-N(6)/adenine(1519)-N(6))-dimethyltransferase RsmA [Lactobacillus sp.]|jgi:16S rRNA (adenine1518-N6/adenine1519-N6)-dimethyltransferase